MTDLKGKKFGRLVVVDLYSKDKWNNFLWECKCECGAVVQKRAYYLSSGQTKSCGCLKTDAGREQVRKIHDRRMDRNLGRMA